VGTAVIDGIATRYEVVGSGPALLRLSPGGFDATLAKWSTQGIYARIKPVEHLSRNYSCIIFDRRESGESGGRVEQLNWMRYATQAKRLLEHLGIERAHVMGACMGCPPALAFGVAYPSATASLVLYWPVGGVHYRISSHARVAEHLEYVRQNGLEGVVSLVTAEGKTFNQDPRGGMWASVIRRDAAFAKAYVSQSLDRYMRLVAATRHTLFDRDTAPGAQPESLFRLDISTLVVPGRDKTHATSAARYLEECLPRSQYWDVPVEAQTEQAASARLLGFLDNLT
jgi:pimeloyl-ACP methyl ester carboxylesterase